MEEKNKEKGDSPIKKVAFILEQANETNDKRCFSCGEEGGEMLSIRVVIHCKDKNGNKNPEITKTIYEIKCCQDCLDQIMGIYEETDEEIDLVFPLTTELPVDEINPVGYAA